MPPKAKLTKTDILDASLAVVRECGVDSLNARSLAVKIGCSTRPLYSVYQNMDEIKNDLFEYANGYFGDFLQSHIAEITKVDNAFLNFGLTYIHFATQEPNLFRLLFLTEKIGAKDFEGLVSPVDHAFILNSIGTGESDMTEAVAAQYFLDMWIYTHGMAMMAAFGGMEVSDDEIIAMLTRISKSVKNTGEKNNEKHNT